LNFSNTIKSIAIGSFDGIHLGHQALLNQVEAVVIIERNTGYLTPGYKRCKHTNVLCFFYHFDKIKSLIPHAFVEKLKSDFPNLQEIVVGYDFYFGKNREGNPHVLQSLFEGKVTIIKQVCIDEIPVHSRTIKQMLREGKIVSANTLLDRSYQIEGVVIKGQGLGKQKLVPTLNLKIEHYQLPQEGVYATRTKIGAKWYDSVSFLGHRMTTDDQYAVESHIPNEEIGAVEGKVVLEFVDFIRKNQKFKTLEALKIQIENDIKKAKAYLK